MKAQNDQRLDTWAKVRDEIDAICWQLDDHSDPPLTVDHAIRLFPNYEQDIRDYFKSLDTENPRW